MPGPFTHVYTARRVADLLGSLTNEFIRPVDDPLAEEQALDAGLLKSLDPQRCADAMNGWPKFTALGAVGPDLFFFLQDYKQPAIPCDEIMLAMSILYYLDDQGRLDDPYDGLLLILAEVSGTWAGILRLLIKLNQAWKKFVEVWDATVGPILDKAGQVVDDLTGGLLSTLGDAITELKNALIAIAAEELLTSADVFSWFALGMRSGYDEKAFLWSDMLHYRRTSVVPQRLLEHARKLAQGNELDRRHAEQLTAYALGWICHVGTDVVAHSFVNEQCGGPFRTHWQRHHLIENHVDAWNYERTGDGTLPADDFIGFKPTYESLNESALYFAVQIPQGIDGLPEDEQQGDLREPLPDGDDRASRAAREDLLDTDGAMPDWLANVIVQVLIEVYADPKDGGMAGLQEEPTPNPLNLLGSAFQNALGGGSVLLGKWLDALGIDRSDVAMDELRQAVAPAPPFNVPPGFPLPWEVQAAYRFMLSWFKRSYLSTFDMKKPKRPTVFTPPASDFDFGPPDFSGVSSSDDPISEACAVLKALLDWIWKTLEKAAQAAYDIAKTVASAATWPARELIYETIILPCWQVAENVRLVLAHLGYLMPQSEQRYPDGELAKPSEIDLQIITLGHTVDSAFQQALAACFDVLGNLDDDPALLNAAIRNPKSADYPWLPIRERKRPDNAGRDVVEFRRPWGYPDHTNETNSALAGNRLEAPLTTAGPYPEGAMPTLLLATNGPASNELRRIYQRAGCPRDTDLYNTRYVGHSPFTAGYPRPDGSERASGTNPLGDPVVFSAYLIGQIGTNPKFAANFNLDADRGYGYLCWDWTRGPKPAADPDPRGHPFGEPRTWPEGSDLWNPPDASPVGQTPTPQQSPPLELRYPGRRCKEEHETTDAVIDDGGVIR
jgi:hypothetical protein